MSGCTCPICKRLGARWGVSKGGAGRVYIVCSQPGCGAQIFARSDDADERIRDTFIAGAAPAGAEHNVTGGAPVRTEMAEGGLMTWDN